MRLSKLQKKILRVVRNEPGIRRRFLFMKLWSEVRTSPYCGRNSIYNRNFRWHPLNKEEQKLYNKKQVVLSRSLRSLEEKGLIKYSKREYDYPATVALANPSTDAR